MNALTLVLLIFAIIGALDRIFGNRLGLGYEFECGFELMGAMSLSMIGMIVLAPAIGAWMTPLFDGFYNLFKIDPSIIPASLLANDMGGAALSTAIAKDTAVGNFNAFIVSAMMGVIISFTIPFSAGIVKKEQHKELFLGFLCAIVTIPLGCFAAGFFCGLTFIQILLDLLPLILISAIIVIGLIFAPSVCIKAFSVLSFIMKALITDGLIIGIISFLTGNPIFASLDSLENATMVCMNAAITLAGAFPLMFVVGKILKKPSDYLGKKLGINSTSALALIPTLVTNSATFGMMRDMDKKGVVLNAAFAASAAFVFGSHLGFTMAINDDYIVPMMIAKFVSGFSALFIAMIVYKPDKASE